MTFSVRFVSSVILLSVCLLPTIFGSALPEIFGGWSRGNDGGDGSSTVFSATDFLQRAYRIQELQTEYHSDYSLLRFNLADMQGISVAWCPTTKLESAQYWHRCFLYKDGPAYIERGQIIIFYSPWRPDAVQNGPVTFSLHVVSDVRGEQYEAAGDVTVNCRGNRCMANREQEEGNVLKWQGRTRPRE